jgi:ABC-type Fe3+-hydroxamate transport system substrate-binding protein
VHPLGAHTWFYGGPRSAELVAERLADALAGEA